MIVLVALVLAQGPGSTLELSNGSSTLTPSTVPPSTLQASPLKTSEGSTIKLRGADALIRKVNLVEGGSFPCEVLASLAMCDDPKVMTFALKNEPLVLSENTPAIVPHYAFTALTPGRTTCSCGQPRALQLVYEFTVGSLEEAVLPVARKVVGAAYARLYTHRRSLVP